MLRSSVSGLTIKFQFNQLNLRFLSIATARSTLSQVHLLPLMSAPLATRTCPGRLILHHDWHRTDNLPQVLKVAKIAASGGEDSIGCICGDQCQIDRKKLFEGLLRALTWFAETSEEYPLE